MKTSAVGTLTRSTLVVAAVALLSPQVSALSATWTELGTNNLGVSWVAAAASSDASRLVALGRLIPNGRIYTSTNYGSTWMLKTNLPLTYNWYAAASSADGAHLVGVMATGQFYASTNFGETWFAAETPGLPWQNVVSSADGKILAATARSVLCISTNAGLTWRTNRPAGPAPTWSSVACSADGTRLVFAPNPGPICISTNSGENWDVTSAPTTNYYSVASTIDGACVIAAVGGPSTPGLIYISTNFGSDWSPTSAPVTNWYAVQTSANADKICAMSAGVLWTSVDRGSNWVADATPYNLSSRLTLTPDGARCWLVGGGPMYTAQSVTPPRLNLLTAGGNANLSWLVPSAEFVLEQSADLDPSSWAAVPFQATLNPTNLQKQVAVPIATNCFFRLKMP